jgi:hypothetical protein
MIKEIVIDYRAVYGRNYHLNPQWHDSHLSREVLEMLYFLNRYGAKVTIVAAYSLIYGVDFEQILWLLDGPPLYVPDQKKEEMLCSILAYTGVSPREILYVDNDPESIRQAKLVGVHTCGITNGRHPEANLRKVDPLWLVDSLPYIIPITAAQLAQY